MIDTQFYDQTPIDTSGLLADPDRPSLKVLLATTWDIPCGIAEHAFYLKEAVEKADPKIEVVPVPEALDPASVDRGDRSWDLLHLNYHAALHSRWTPDTILNARASQKYKGVVTTYHDTGVPNSQQCLDVVRASSAAVLHEPFEGSGEFGENPDVYYWRMGVPEVTIATLQATRWNYPILGTVGFPFGWKCYDELAKITEQVGWGLLLIAPTATQADEDRWLAINPKVNVLREFLPRDEVVGELSLCDATAFTYVCCNTGQSAAILQGIAAKKPVFALSTCRQMRGLWHDHLARRALCWINTFEELAHQLSDGMLHLGRLDTSTVALAHQERWSEIGKKYAALYRKVAQS